MTDLPTDARARLSALSDAYGPEAVKRLWDATETWPDLDARIAAIEKKLQQGEAQRRKLAHQASLEDAALEAEGTRILEAYGAGSMREAFGAFMDELRQR